MAVFGKWLAVRPLTCIQSARCVGRAGTCELVLLQRRLSSTSNISWYTALKKLDANAAKRSDFIQIFAARRFVQHSRRTATCCLMDNRASHEHDCRSSLTFQHALEA